MSLEALSLAAAIVQFADHARNITKWTIEVYNSIDGATANNRKLEQFTEEVECSVEDLLENRQIKWSSGLDEEEEEAIGRLAIEARSVAKKLLGLLHRLRGKKSGIKGKLVLSGIIKSIKTTIKAEEIKGLQDEINILSGQISRRLIRAIV
ncbi:hypothetical protein BJ508DRAFT_336270 [Ascobolus immersus RN42]|uniref:NACHT-NTPase and P-loop NTPases N-terminal domain-containing protein n=1 Tax=Ascobolus immersus RN42 TaxID=1160509 RepID=A0A3N4HBQ3_ASCIM|nr:hypothetical protein BJ508DRAFT_336270 [Ascobolus immersus RN42]